MSGRSFFTNSLIGMISIALGVASAGCSMMQPSGPMHMSQPELYLFVQTASSGTFAPVNAAAGVHRLTLQNVSPNVLFFSDRPNRDTGSISVKSYLDDVFAPTEPDPNGALVIELGSGQLTIALELSEPNYNPGTHVLTYQVRQLNNVSEGLSHLTFDQLSSLPAQFGAAELFIDSDDWHRCNLKLENGLSDTPLYLDTASVEPSLDGDRWATVTKTISANGSGTMTFKYHSNTDDKNATIPYLIGDQWLDKTIQINLDCLMGLGSNVNKQKTTCTSDTTGYKCEFQRFDDFQKTVVYKVTKSN